MPYGWWAAGGMVVIAAAACAVLVAGWFVPGAILILGVAALQAAGRRAVTPSGPAWEVFWPTAAYYALGLALAGGAVYAIRFQDSPHPELAGAAAFAGAAVGGYMTGRVRASLGPETESGGPAGWLALLVRGEVLLAVLAAGTVFGQSYVVLWACAALSGMSIAGRLAVLRVTAIRAV